MNSKVNAGTKNALVMGSIAAMFVLLASPFSSVSPLALTSASAQSGGDNNNTTTDDNNGNAVGYGTMMPAEHRYILSGQISNVQLDNNSQPAWVENGIWLLRAENDTNGNMAARFLAKFEMVKTDGTAMHSHYITNFHLTSAGMKGNSTYVLNGTATVSLMNKPVTDVPMTIKIMHRSVIAIWIGPQAVNDHFGTGPIYGTVAHRGMDYGMMGMLPGNGPMMKDHGQHGNGTSWNKGGY
jgi:hypothetical protein